MSSAKRRKCRSLEHKMTTTLFVIILLLQASTVALFISLSEEGNTLGMALPTALAVTLALLTARSTAKLLGFKFVGQVNKMTGTARAIAHSRDLSKRVNASARPDELSYLATALNEMLARLEEAFEGQKRFTADASHELRTPIAVLNGYLDILQQWGKNDPAILEESLAAMKEETQHMKKLSENLLLMSRLELDRERCDWGTVKLHHVIQKIAKDGPLIAGDRTFRVLEAAALRVEGDQTLLLQMLRAVFENSIKYTAEDGVITIRLRREGDQAVIEIKDNGVGIPEEDLPRIFDRFYQVGKDRDRAKGGTGLGLSLVQHIAALHGGSVSANSVLGQGTTIRISLPLSL